MVEMCYNTIFDILAPVEDLIGAESWLKITSPPIVEASKVGLFVGARTMIVRS